MIRPRARRNDSDEAFFEELKALIVNATGNHFFVENDETLRRGIDRRITELGLSSYADYCAILKRGAADSPEFDSLVADLTIGETYFFRYEEQFKALREAVLPDLLQHSKAHRRLRIWSAGCASGAEAYSIAIALDQLLGTRRDDWDITIIATDINRRFLATAEQGLFGNAAFRSVSNELKSTYFHKAGDRYQITERYRRMVTFVYHNLVHNSIPCISCDILAFDIIFCRNVMIYFDPETNSHLADQFEACLVDGGWLFVGHAETNAKLNQLFDPVSFPGATVYRKRHHGAVAPHPASPIRRNAPRPPVVPNFRPAQPRRHAPSEAKLADALLSRSRADAPVASGVAVAPAQSGVDAIIDQANRGRWEAAADLCDTLLSRDPLDPTVHYYSALVFLHMGLTAASEDALRRAIYLDRAFVLAHYQLGLIRRMAGDATASSKSFHNVLECLEGAADDHPVSPREQITAADLREIAKLQLQRGTT